MPRQKSASTRPRDFTEAAITPPLCMHAKALQAWYAEHIEKPLGQNASLGKLREARLQLADNFMQRHQDVPSAHLKAAAASNGHRCIIDVFEHLYRALYQRELDHAPRPLGTAPPPPPQRSTDDLFTGLILGEDLGEGLR